MINIAHRGFFEAISEDTAAVVVNIIAEII